MKDTKESVVVSGWRSKAVDDVLASLLPVVAKSAEGRQGVAEAQKSKKRARRQRHHRGASPSLPLSHRASFATKEDSIQSLNVPHTGITCGVDVTKLCVLCLIVLWKYTVQDIPSYRLPRNRNRNVCLAYHVSPSSIFHGCCLHVCMG